MAPATRWGIAGAGKISHDFTLALTMLSNAEHKVSAVAARSLDRAEGFAKMFDIPKTYGSYQELANDPDIDVVYVGSIHPEHAEMTKMMIRAGKNVLCEKPLTMNLKQAKEVVALAREKGVFLMEAFWSRFFPITSQLRELLKDGKIGDVRHVLANFGIDMSTKDRIAEKSLGGGSLLDLGCYGVQFAMMVYGEKPHKCLASGILTAQGTDEMVSATLYFSERRTAQINLNVDVTLDNQATICGKEGIITLPGFWSPISMKTPTEVHQVPLPTAPKPMIHDRSEGFTYEATAVRQCLLKGLKEHPDMTLDESLEIMAVLDDLRAQVGVVYDADEK